MTAMTAMTESSLTGSIYLLIFKTDLFGPLWYLFNFKPEVEEINVWLTKMVPWIDPKVLVANWTLFELNGVDLINRADLSGAMIEEMKKLKSMSENGESQSSQ